MRIYSKASELLENLEEMLLAASLFQPHSSVYPKWKGWKVPLFYGMGLKITLILWCGVEKYPYFMVWGWKVPLFYGVHSAFGIFYVIEKWTTKM